MLKHLGMKKKEVLFNILNVAWKIKSFQVNVKTTMVQPIDKNKYTGSVQIIEGFRCFA